METSVTIYWIALNFRYVQEKGKKGKRREHIPLAEGCHQSPIPQVQLNIYIYYTKNQSLD